ncbi:MAG: serine/threonine-protein kinase [Sandaracinaceae bacterium]
MVEYPDYADDEDSDDHTVLTTGMDLGAFFAQRYRIDEVLGAGAMGKVFRATDMSDDRQVAVKVLHPDKAAKESVLTRFRREAEILGQLGHHGIVEIYDYGQDRDGVDYIVMELIEGDSLKQHVREHGPMSPDGLLPLLIILCDAIGAAHEQGIIHRDLKPDNVIIFDRSGELRAKVLDFGLSRLGTNKRITATGVMIGTPRYMAPEQIRSAKDVDERTDIYACGVLVYEALTGKSPFPAEDAGQLLGCVIENRTVPLVEVRPDLPEALGEVVHRAMAKHPSDRYSTMGAFVEAFAAALGRSTGRSHLLAEDGFFAEQSDPEFSVPLAAMGGGNPRFTLPPGMPLPSPPTPRSRRPLFLGFGLLALLMVGCLAAAAAFGLRRMLLESEPPETGETVHRVG